MICLTYAWVPKRPTKLHTAYSGGCMRINKIDNQVEKQLATGLIVNKRFIEGMETIYRPGLISVPFVKTIAGWCFDYYKEYNSAPKKHIQDIYNSAKRDGLHEDQAELIGEFLTTLSEEYARAEKFNVRYVLDQVEKHLKVQHIKSISEDITAYLSKGEVTEAELLIEEYKRVERPTSQGIDLFNDKNIVREAFERNETDILFQMPGDLGKFLGPVERDSFTSFEGPEKKGKSFWLAEIALHAHRSLCNVAFFAVGDMSALQIVRRVYLNILKQPRRFKGEVKLPVLDCQWNQDDSCEKRNRTSDIGVVEETQKGFKKTSLEDAERDGYKPCTICKKECPKDYKGAVWYKNIDVTPADNWRTAYTAGKKRQKRLGNKRFKLMVYPSRGINIKGIKTQLDTWERNEGFIADIVVIDYADTLDKEPKLGNIDYRNAINETWAAMRGLSQERQIAVFTATQSAATAYKKKTIKEGDFSEDKRKRGHVTGIITLNQTGTEKEEGIMRIGKMFVREDEGTRKTVTVLECRKLGRPYLGSFL